MNLRRSREPRFSSSEDFYDAGVQLTTDLTEGGRADVPERLEVAMAGSTGSEVRGLRLVLRDLRADGAARSLGLDGAVERMLTALDDALGPS